MRYLIITAFFASFVLACGLAKDDSAKLVVPGKKANAQDSVRQQSPSPTPTPSIDDSATDELKCPQLAGSYSIVPAPNASPSPTSSPADALEKSVTETRQVVIEQHGCRELTLTDKTTVVRELKNGRQFIRSQKYHYEAKAANACDAGEPNITYNDRLRYDSCANLRAEQDRLVLEINLGNYPEWRERSFAPVANEPGVVLVEEVKLRLKTDGTLERTPVSKEKMKRL